MIRDLEKPCITAPRYGDNPLRIVKIPLPNLLIGIKSKMHCLLLGQRAAILQIDQEHYGPARKMYGSF